MKLSDLSEDALNFASRADYFFDVERVGNYQNEGAELITAWTALSRSDREDYTATADRSTLRSLLLFLA